jgi:hypothetical protein
VKRRKNGHLQVSEERPKIDPSLPALRRNVPYGQLPFGQLASREENNSIA